MSGGGRGKGDSKTQTIELPPEIAAAAQRNLGAAERAAGIGYVPYQGPTVAALNPMQVDAMAGRADMASAFGMGPGGAAVRASIPAPTTYANGMQGYDPMALYLQALSKISPTQRAAIESFTGGGAAAAPAAAAKTRVPAVNSREAARLRQEQQWRDERMLRGGGRDR